MIIDSREPTSNEEYIKTISPDSKKQFIECGDYLLPNGYAVERKKGRDLMGSLLSKRLFEQLINLCQYDYPILAVITDNIWKDFYFSKSNYIHNIYQGTLATIVTKFPKIRVIQFEDDKQFMDFIVLLEKKLLDTEKAERPVIMGRKSSSPSEIQENIICQLPGVGLVMAKKLLHEFKNIEGICNASEDDLLKIDKMGKKTSSKIIEILHIEYHKNLRE